eukprot:snap_masked-scaffold_74-processed-gene-0.32-mRNA-1 protein AED:1.00 eAED:1.00 QI:0/0/0/0/1/1/5/0/134
MSFKAPSIKQQFENRNESIESNDDIHNPIEGERFRIEAQEFVEEVDVHEEIERLAFYCCPLNLIGHQLSVWLVKFPKIKQLQFVYCHLNNLNIIAMERNQQKMNILVLNFAYCNIPDDNSLSRFLKGQKIKSIR